jgi:hypothetical protein
VLAAKAEKDRELRMGGFYLGKLAPIGEIEEKPDV